MKTSRHEIEILSLMCTPDAEARQSDLAGTISEAL